MHDDWHNCMGFLITTKTNARAKMGVRGKSAEDLQHLIHTCGILTDGKICGAFL